MFIKFSSLHSMWGTLIVQIQIVLKYQKHWLLIVLIAAVDLESKKSGISKGVIVGIVLGGLSIATAIVLVIAVVFWKKQTRHGHKDSKQQPCEFI